MSIRESDAPTIALPPRVVVMGVTGCGKSTVGAALAAHLGIRFADGDAFHPQANIEKMAAGHSLNDDDRLPWLYTLAGWLRAHDDRGAVLGCSALKRSYRDILRSGAEDLIFLHLDITPEVSLERVNSRPGHFMPASLVESQFATLERLGEDERHVVIDGTASLDDIIDTYLEAFPLLEG